MDELVTVGAAGLIGLAILGILIAAGVLWYVSVIWTACITGNMQTIILLAAASGLALVSYIGIGFWLQKIGRI